MTVQAWLAGAADAPGELGKMVYKRLAEETMPLGARLDLLERLIGVSGDILAFLNQYVGIGIPDPIMNVTRRRGYFNTYRGKLTKIAGFIEKDRREVAQLKNMMAVFEAYGLTKKEG